MPRWSRLAALGAGAAAYSFYEPYRYRLESKAVPIARPLGELTVLHISDTHIDPRDVRLIQFLKELPDRLGQLPDLVLSTGDMIDGDEGIDTAVTALSGLRARIGRFYVLGSHDYYLSAGPAYTKYFTGAGGHPRAKTADTLRLEQGLQADGWVSLRNRTELVNADLGTIRLSGVDDPYIRRHRTQHIESAADEILAIGLVHAPDVVSEWVLNGFDLVVAGHTHGGQVRMPGFGAIVTNCRLPSSLAGGLSRIGSSWLHVSRGLGTGRYAPVRFACTPEATLLTLIGPRKE